MVCNTLKILSHQITCKLNNNKKDFKHHSSLRSCPFSTKSVSPFSSSLKGVCDSQSCPFSTKSVSPYSSSLKGVCDSRKNINPPEGGGGGGSDPSQGGGQRGGLGPTLGDGVALLWLRSRLNDGVINDEAIEDLKN